MACLQTRMLTDSIILEIPASVTIWQDAVKGNAIALSKVHVQRQSGFRTTSNNAEVQPHATIWYDCKISTPHRLDFMALKAAAEDVGAPLFVTYGGVKYTVASVVEFKDGIGKLHHYEIEVI